MSIKRTNLFIVQPNTVDRTFNLLTSYWLPYHRYSHFTVTFFNTNLYCLSSKDDFPLAKTLVGKLNVVWIDTFYSLYTFRWGRRPLCSLLCFRRVWTHHLVVGVAMVINGCNDFRYLLSNTQNITCIIYLQYLYYMTFYLFRYVSQKYLHKAEIIIRRLIYCSQPVTTRLPRTQKVDLPERE